MQRSKHVQSAGAPLSERERSWIAQAEIELAAELERLRILQQRYKHAPTAFGLIFMMAIAFVAGFLIGRTP